MPESRIRNFGYRLEEALDVDDMRLQDELYRAVETEVFHNEGTPKIDCGYLLRTLEASIMVQKEPDEVKCKRCGEWVTTNGPEITRGVPYHTRNGRVDIYCRKCYDETFFTCNRCRKIHKRKGSITIAGKTFCKQCFDTMYGTCDYCGEATARTGLVDRYGKQYCRACDTALYGLCEACRGEFRKGQLHESRGAHYCERCIDMVNVQCPMCGENAHVSDMTLMHHDRRWYCPVCYRNLTKEFPIHEYGYKPPPIFYPRPVKDSDLDDKLYEGTEIEADDGGRTDENCKTILKLAGDDRFYIKTDSSVRRGVEIVSYPMTLEYHMTEVPYQDLFKWMRERGYTAHDTTTCGLHVHINRSYIGGTAEQDAFAMNMLLLYEKFWDKIVVFSRRGSEVDSYAKRLKKIDGEPREKMLERGKTADRHSAINLRNKATIEFRVFRGTLLVEQYFAVLQFVRVTTDLMKSMTLEQVETMTWDDFAMMLIGNYKELDNELHKAGLVTYGMINEKNKTKAEVSS